MLGKTSVLKFTAVALGAWLLNACSFAPPGAPSFTVISDQADKAQRHYVSSGAPVEDKDCLTSVFFHFIWFGTTASEESLLSKILEEHNADALIDTDVRYSFFIVPYVFSRSCLIISGTPAKLRGTP
jgi:hypothetical protein